MVERVQQRLLRRIEHVSSPSAHTSASVPLVLNEAVRRPGTGQRNPVSVRQERLRVSGDKTAKTRGAPHRHKKRRIEQQGDLRLQLARLPPSGQSGLASQSAVQAGRYFAGVLRQFSHLIALHARKVAAGL